MRVQETSLDGVLEIIPRRFGDDRGWFCETWSRPRMAEAGLALDFLQDNHSFSAEVGTLRGLHYQAPPHAQAKLVRCTRGAIRDVAVDVRRGSPSFGHWIALELTDKNSKQLIVPEGFLHGFITLEPNSEVQYKVTDVYVPDCDGTVRWDSVGIDWELLSPPVLSEKDATAPTLEEWVSPFTWEGGR